MFYFFIGFVVTQYVRIHEYDYGSDCLRDWIVTSFYPLIEKRACIFGDNGLLDKQMEVNGTHFREGSCPTCLTVPCELSDDWTPLLLCQAGNWGVDVVNQFSIPVGDHLRLLYGGRESCETRDTIRAGTWEKGDCYREQCSGTGQTDTPYYWNSCASIFPQESEPLTSGATSLLGFLSLLL